MSQLDDEPLHADYERMLAALAALAAALLVATGRRLRGEVQHVGKELVDDAAARSRLAAVGIAMG